MGHFWAVFSPDQRVDLADLDVVQLLHSRLDLVLVGFDVGHEHEGVVVLDLLHRRLRRQGVLDDVMGVHPAKTTTSMLDLSKTRIRFLTRK